MIFGFIRQITMVRRSSSLLNVSACVLTGESGLRHLVDKYADEGVQRFVDGRYSSGLPCGGMVGYVMDNQTALAFASIQQEILKKRSALKLPNQYDIRTPSAVLPNYEWSADTLQLRKNRLSLPTPSPPLGHNELRQLFRLTIFTTRFTKSVLHTSLLSIASLPQNQLPQKALDALVFEHWTVPDHKSPSEVAALPPGSSRFQASPRLCLRILIKRHIQ